MDKINLYKELVIIRTLLDEDLPKGKQALTLLLKEMEDGFRDIISNSKVSER